MTGGFRLTGRRQTAKRFIICGMGLSEPGTMGGNSKIALELARCLSDAFEVHFILPDRKVETVTGALGDTGRIALHPVAGFKGNDLRHPFASARHYTCVLREALRALGANAGDVVYACSDFHVDTLPCSRLKREFGYTWIATQFLFVPFIFENLLKRYRFPALTYLMVWFYSRLFFRIARRKADGFVITNDSDLTHFPESFRSRVFPIYGGVNIEQIPDTPATPSRDVVFCSRLHPQKGIDGFLDIWKRVRTQCPDVRLTVIGNGAPDYTRALKRKAERLGIAGSVDWLGYVNNEAKYAIYRSARILVHPTVFDNNGMVAAEALCSGLPVVMYDLPALRHVYTTGCVKVPYGDQAAFAAALVKLLTEPEAYAAVAPTPEQQARLREQWAWRNRVRSFETWLTPISTSDGNA